MLVKLTNTSTQFMGDPIYINSDHITCIYNQPNTEGGSLKTLVHSRIGSGGNITWEVEESPSEIMKLIEGKNAKCKNCSCN
jgi:uncharacterized protein YlzI (FlbEa/FlbD family)